MRQENPGNCDHSADAGQVNFDSPSLKDYCEQRPLPPLSIQWSCAMSSVTNNWRCLLRCSCSLKCILLMSMCAFVEIIPRPLWKSNIKWNYSTEWRLHHNTSTILPFTFSICVQRAAVNTIVLLGPQKNTSQTMCGLERTFFSSHLIQLHHLHMWTV